MARVDSVPDDYYSITNIMRTNTIHESKETIFAYRKNTLMNILSEMDKECVVNIGKWWYSHINQPDIEVPYGADVIWFMKNSYLARVVKLIEVFAEDVQKNTKNGVRNYIYISFGIKKDFFDRYFTSKGKDVPTVKPRSVSNFQKNSNEWISVDGSAKSTNQIKAKRVPELQRWKDWCKLNGVTQSNAVISALKEQVESNPTEGLPDISHYTTETVTLVQKQGLKDSIAAKVQRPEADVMKSIIRAYNKKHHGDIKGEMTITRYLSLAVKMLNDVMAPEYLYKEEIEYTKDQLQKIEDQINTIKEKM